MHIAIEGIDGVGKTTLSKKLAKIIDYKFIEKPLSELTDKKGMENYLRIRDYINQQNDNHVLTSWFYGLGNLYATHKYGNMNIITDRYYLSNWFWGGEDCTAPIFELLLKLNGKPDLTVILWCDNNALEKRLLERSTTDNDIGKIKLNNECKLKMESFCKKYEFNYILIDSSNKTVDDVADLIIKGFFDKELKWKI